MTNYFVSLGTLLTIVVGAIIAYVYLLNMWEALRRSIETRSETDDKTPDRFHFGLGGAILSVIISSLAITAYGLHPFLLYLGPISALLSPIAVSYCLYEESTDV